MLSANCITFEGLPNVICSWFPAPMETQDIRLARFRLIWERDYKKNITALAKVLEKDKNQVRFYLNPEKPGGRWMGEDMARYIEFKLALPPLWLDQETDATQSESARIIISAIPLLPSYIVESWVDVAQRALALPQTINIKPELDYETRKAALELADQLPSQSKAAYPPIAAQTLVDKKKKAKA